MTLHLFQIPFDLGRLGLEAVQRLSDITYHKGFRFSHLFFSWSTGQLQINGSVPTTIDLPKTVRIPLGYSKNFPSSWS